MPDDNLNKCRSILIDDIDGGGTIAENDFGANKCYKKNDYD